MAEDVEKSAGKTGGFDRRQVVEKSLLLGIASKGAGLLAGHMFKRLIPRLQSSNLSPNPMCHERPPCRQANLRGDRNAIRR